MDKNKLDTPFNEFVSKAKVYPPLFQFKVHCEINILKFKDEYTLT